MCENGIKPWEDLTFKDDYMFKLVMRRKRLCKRMIERILRIKVKDIKYLEEEKHIKASYYGKGIRLDVYVADEKGTVISIEMQVRNMANGGLFMRMRYYQSLIDADLLAAGADYDKLNPTYIIFICPFALFDGQRHIYTFKSVCVEDNALNLPDGTTKIFLSTKGKLDDIPADLKAFLDYVDGTVSDDDLVQEIDSTIKELKLQEAERMSYMTFAMKLLDERKAGREEGLREGLREGRREGRREGLRDGREKIVKNVYNLMKNIGLSLEQALAALGITQKEFDEYQAMLASKG